MQQAISRWIKRVKMDGWFYPSFLSLQSPLDVDDANSAIAGAARNCCPALAFKVGLYPFLNFLLCNFIEREFSSLPIEIWFVLKERERLSFRVEFGSKFHGKMNNVCGEIWFLWLKKKKNCLRLWRLFYFRTKKDTIKNLLNKAIIILLHR